MREAPTTSTDSTSTDSTPKFTLGIDVGKKALEVTLFDQEGEVANTSVSNDSGGREVLLNWLEAWGASPENTCACMESSGGFEEAVATLLYEEDYSVSVVNPRRIKGYADSQLRRSKTDSADASLLARYGQREDPRLWDPPTAAESRLRELTRARQALKKEALKKEKTRTENRLDEVEDQAVRDAYEDLLDEIEEKIDVLEERPRRRDRGAHRGKSGLERSVFAAGHDSRRGTANRCDRCQRAPVPGPI
jgi:transposase